MKTILKNIKGHLSPLLLLAAVLHLVACDASQRRKLSALGSSAEGEISLLQADHDTVLTGEEPDYGVVVTFVITNNGDKGMLSIRPWVSCSDGEFTRTQNLEFAKGESRSLRFFFHEPTVSASNIEAGVQVTPSAAGGDQETVRLGRVGVPGLNELMKMLK